MSTGYIKSFSIKTHHINYNPNTPIYILLARCVKSLQTNKNTHKYKMMLFHQNIFAWHNILIFFVININNVFLYGL